MSSSVCEIFPDNLISGSVKSQKELEDSFKKYSSLSRTYIQTALYWQDYRKWYEDYWPKVYKYLDSDFVDKFKTEKGHAARAWEFHLAVVFIEKGIKLKEKTWEHGPDFCINISDCKNLWIEAIACDKGNKDPVECFPEGGNIEKIHRSRALRITSAIEGKFKKFKKYLENSKKFGVNKDDCLLIAINGGSLNYSRDSSELIKRAVFAKGLDVYTKDRKGNLKGPFYKPNYAIARKDKTKKSIPANFMEIKEFSKISGVLYCGYPTFNSWNNSYKTGDDFLFAYHTNPNNPIPEDFFDFGRGIRKDIKVNTITEFDQNKTQRNTSK
jgi:hypothetical protein